MIMTIRSIDKSGETIKANAQDGSMCIDRKVDNVCFPVVPSNWNMSRECL